MLKLSHFFEQHISIGDQLIPVLLKGRWDSYIFSAQKSNHAIPCSGDILGKAFSLLECGCVAQSHLKPRNSFYAPCPDGYVKHPVLFGNISTKELLRSHGDSLIKRLSHID